MGPGGPSRSSACSGGVPKDKVTVVIPTLDEEEAIGLVIDELRGLGFNNMLVVDGGSRDGTREVAASKGARVVVQDGRGKADALRTALGLVNTPYVLVIDGDHTYDPSRVDEMLRLAPAYDEVIGVRAWGRENIPPINRLGNRVINAVFNALFGTRLRDVCSGMYLLRVEALRGLGFESRGFSVEVEIAAHIASTTRRIAEVWIRYRRRIGRSKLGRTWGLRIVTDSVRMAWRYNPFFLIFLAGSLLAVPGIAMLAWAFVRYVLFDAKHFVWALLGANLLGAGAVSLLLALLSLYIKRFELRVIERLGRLERADDGC